MSNKLLYLFGEPGTGKITVARILQERLGWRLFWLHDLDGVCAIVGRYPLPRLMDKISLTVLEELMDGGENIIYARPSRDRETVERVQELSADRGYHCLPVRLCANYDTMVSRVSSRKPSPFRISSKGEFDQYSNDRPSTSLTVSAYTIYTGSVTADRVADEIQHKINARESSNGKRSDRAVTAASCG